MASSKKGIPIPKQRIRRDFPAGLYSTSLTSQPFSSSETPPKTRHSHDNASTSFNIYSSSIMTSSPLRSTSVMFGYYSSPRPSNRYFRVDDDDVTDCCHNNQLCNYPHRHQAASGSSSLASSAMTSEIRRYRSYSESDQLETTSSVPTSGISRNSNSTFNRIRRKLSRTVSLGKRNKESFRSISESTADDDVITANSNLDSIFNSLAISPEVMTSSLSDFVFQRLLEEHTCYELMPTSSKIVMFDVTLKASQTLPTLLDTGECAAVLWDSPKSIFRGILSVADFIDVIVAYQARGILLKSIEHETIVSWRQTLGVDDVTDHISVTLYDSLMTSLQLLHDHNLEGLPIRDGINGDVIHVITRKRLLRFLHLFLHEVPSPAFMTQTLWESGLGRWGAEEVATINRDSNLAQALELISEFRLSGIPVVENDRVVDVFHRMDMILLAALDIYHQLDMKMDQILQLRQNLYSNNCVEEEVKKKKKNLKNIEEGKKRKVERSSSSSSSKRSLTSKKSKKSSSEDSEHLLHHQKFQISKQQPLVKCKSSDNLHSIFERLVTSDVDMLVVVDNDDVIEGVVTCTEFLNYIADPQQNRCLWRGKKKEKERRDLLRHQHLQALRDAKPRNDVINPKGRSDDVIECFGSFSSEDSAMMTSRTTADVITYGDSIVRT